MQKQQLITLGIVLVLGLIGGIYLIVEPKDPPGPPPPPIGPFPPKGEEIKNEITIFGNNPWDKSKYEDLISKINTSKTNELIKKEEQISLLEYSEVTYVNTINQAAKTFFKSAQNESKLGEIYKELKRYQNDKYKVNVHEMISTCGKFYVLKKLTNEINSFDYYNNGGENTIANYFNRLDKFKSENYLKNSPLVQAKIKTAKSSLQSKMSTAIISEMRPKIDNYTRLQKFVSETTNDFKKQLMEIEQNSLLNNSNQIKAFVSSANSDLDAHETVDLKMRNLKFNPNSCEDICGRHTYYLDLCTNERAEKNVKSINPSNTSGY